MCHEHVLTQDPERLLEAETVDLEEDRAGPDEAEAEPQRTVEVPA